MKKLLTLGICLSFLLAGCSSKAKKENKPQIYCMDSGYDDLIDEYYYNKDGDLEYYGLLVFLSDVDSKKEAEEAIKNVKNLYFYEYLEEEIENGELTYTVLDDNYYARIKTPIAENDSPLGLSYGISDLSYDEVLEKKDALFAGQNCFDQKGEVIEIKEASLDQFPNIEKQMTPIIAEFNKIYSSFTVADFEVTYGLSDTIELMHLSDDYNLYIALDFDVSTGELTELYLDVEKMTDNDRKAIDAIINQFKIADVNEVNAKLDEAVAMQNNEPDNVYEGMVVAKDGAYFDVDYNFLEGKTISIFYSK